MAKPVNVHDFKKLARDKLTKNAWDYYRSGATDEQSLFDNTVAYDRYRLRPTALNDISQVDMSTTILGSKLNFPVCIAATAMNKMAHPEGEIAAAKAAASLGTGYMLSTWSTTSIEDVAEATRDSVKWMQLYIYKDRAVSMDIVSRAERNGFQGIFLTVDTPVLGYRYQDMKNNFSLPPNLNLANFKLPDLSNAVKGKGSSGLAQYVTSLIDPSVQWEDVAWLKSITKLPIVLKGILTAEMARKAVSFGVDGIVVSNHGARQLDGVPATIDALQEVVKAVDGKCEVYLDGGITRGTDVLKAIALGARAVFIGRPALWGLAHNGQEGVRSVLSILQNEFKISMQLVGCRSIKEIQDSADLVVSQSHYKSLL